MTSAVADKQDFWRDRPVLVTGATGLLGGWLVSRLVALGADVVCLVRDVGPKNILRRDDLVDGVKTVRGDINDRDCFERVLSEHEIDTVHHVAAQAIVGAALTSPVETFETNIGGTWRLLEACRRAGVRQVVVASSDKAYGDQAVLPYTEDMPLDGRHPYEASKACADILTQTYARTYGLKAAITRCGNFYGGGDLNWNRMFPGTIRSVLYGQRPVIRSDGTFVRDYFYIEDAAEAYVELSMALARRDDLAGQAFNFSTETPLSALDAVRKILAAMGSTLEPDIRNEVSAEIKHQFLSAKKAREMLGWKPVYPAEDALARTIHWYRDYFERGERDTRISCPGGSRIVRTD
jgi:CDP-glucose 4,6-dehydratase